MRNLLNPKWIFVLNTIPILIMFFIFLGEFNIIKSLLKEESIRIWISFGYGLAVLGLSNFIYGMYLIIKKKNVSVYYGVIALIFHILFIYLYGFHSEDIIPFSIPRWMLSGDVELYVGTFLMPTLAYSLFILVVHFTPQTTESKAVNNILIAILIPLVWYIFTQILFPLWKPVENNYGIHITLIFFIIGTILFLFFILRYIFILATRKASIFQENQLVWKIPISIILPVLGLLVNNGILFNDFNITESGVFGDFNSYWFYLLAVVNGILLCLPNSENTHYRFILFAGRSITLSFTFYFFLVFLPFLPFSIIAIAAIGTGFLMLTPLILFVVHISQLSKDYDHLQTWFSKKKLLLSSVIASLVIPLCIFLTCLNDKSNLNQSLEYIYSPNYTKDYNIDKGSLQKTLHVLENHKDNNRGGIFGSQQPYLSSIFNWIVLDNLTLSDSKINHIQRIFFGEPASPFRFENVRNSNVEISDISTNSTYDETQGTWRTWIDLEITNKSGSARFAEYATTLELPEGTWISDYYLYVGERKEMGILAEKKTAMWVFSSIRNENRDPGILYYMDGNKVAFRVFPFAENEIRKTGIELIHKDPIEFKIDDHTLTLGDSNNHQDLKFENENVIYLSAKEKESLKRVKRKPYFHFIIDASAKENISNYSSRIDKIASQHNSLKENAKVSFVNTYVSTHAFDENWLEAFQSQSFEGGLYVDRAIKTILFDAYKDSKEAYPLIVLVSDSIQNAVFSKDILDWSFTFPENDLFYMLDENGNLVPHALTENPKTALSDSSEIIFDHSVLEYKLNNNSVRYLTDNGQASIVLKNDIFEIDRAGIKNKDWNTALHMKAKWYSQTLHPSTSDRDWINLVEYSFLSGVMTPVTSYLVVENEAQKAILKKKQKQVLSGNKSLDVGEDAESMSEPSLYILVILLSIIFLYRHKRDRITMAK